MVIVPLRPDCGVRGVRGVVVLPVDVHEPERVVSDGCSGSCARDSRGNERLAARSPPRVETEELGDAQLERELKDLKHRVDHVEL